MGKIVAGYGGRGRYQKRGVRETKETLRFTPFAVTKKLPGTKEAAGNGGNRREREK